MKSSLYKNASGASESAGFIKWIIIIIIAVGIISYFGLDLKSIFESETARQNYAWLWNWAVYLWENFLDTPVLWVWNNVVINVFWKIFKLGLENIGNISGLIQGGIK